VKPIILRDSNRVHFEKHLRRDVATGCLLWTGSKSSKGYGRFGVGNREDGFRTELAHRVAWVMAGREITPERPHILHDCPAGDNPACCEIEHLWAGTKAENNRDMAIKGRGARSESGLPFGVRRIGKRFAAQISVNQRQRHLGIYDTWQEAAAIATLHKNLALYPDTNVN
jgi:HNH endonuclease